MWESICSIFPYIVNYFVTENGNLSFLFFTKVLTMAFLKPRSCMTPPDCSLVFSFSLEAGGLSQQSRVLVSSLPLSLYKDGRQGCSSTPSALHRALLLGALILHLACPGVTHATLKLSILGKNHTIKAAGLMGSRGRGTTVIYFISDIVKRNKNLI